MQEDFLHYIWQHQYFDKTDLTTDDGQLITVLRPGHRNPDAGPDFLNARLQVGEVEWSGAVEIHLRASDWHRHHHQTDPKYDQVVLHVVHAADAEVQRTNGSVIPVLELAARLPAGALAAYEQLQRQPPEALLPCAALLPQVPELTRTMMLGRTLLERMEQKADRVTELHERLGQDWEATAWHALAAAFGFQKNNEPLSRLAKALPLALLRRYRADARQLAALMFGQAGFLDDEPLDDFSRDLRTEYEFLRHKHNLHGTALAVHEWNFLRLRPANFPTVRLAQLTALLHARPTLFDALLTAHDVRALEQFFRAPLPEYWQTHTRPGRPGKVAPLGRSSVDLLITNTVVPLRVAHARSVGQPEQVEAALSLLDQLPPEHNRLTDTYEAAGFRHACAADSQALLALERGYCAPRRCVHCGIGASLLRPRRQ
ncbi:hypothetical protein CDA63_14365 [Hymenobacter amundsenii]|uniref:DUF2851 domain-containing protein n=1 Tax=Hymenobacter amundsenii TaxID=2006685 RepID=A0A246FIL3_9BACT|nr:DUF2851 family protein [Hymenobacter amundsenii]OWP62370.1 hypothetical protein CDA63_14365 [Hymenobacter amundsenii]